MSNDLLERVQKIERWYEDEYAEHLTTPPWAIKFCERIKENPNFCFTFFRSSEVDQHGDKTIVQMESDFKATYVRERYARELINFFKTESVILRGLKDHPCEEEVKQKFDTQAILHSLNLSSVKDK